MTNERIQIENIPAIIWGADSDKAYISVHGKKSKKEEAVFFAKIAQEHGYQVLSFDLPEHGERTDCNYPCNIWNGIKDLGIIERFARSRWNNLSLYANSLGAYFSLMTYANMQFSKCLFYSPILDMERLIQNMMKWFNVDEKELEQKGEIETPMGEVLSWEYYSFVRNNRITQWNFPTSILYGCADNLTERSTVDAFVSRFGCNLSTVENGQHYFTTPEEVKALDIWIRSNI